MLPCNDITSCIWLKLNYLGRNMKSVQMNLFYATSRNLLWVVLSNVLHNSKAIIAACFKWYAVNQEFSNPGKMKICFTYSLKPILLAVEQLSWNLHEFRPFFVKAKTIFPWILCLMQLAKVCFCEFFFKNFLTFCFISIFSREQPENELGIQAP